MAATSGKSQRWHLGQENPYFRPFLMVLDIFLISDIIQAGKWFLEKVGFHCRNRLLTARMSGEIGGLDCGEI